MNRLTSYFKVGDRAWAVRRRIVVATLLFCGALIIYAATPYMPQDKANLMVPNMINLMIFVIGYYVFGPVLDDTFKRKWSDNINSSAGKSVVETTTVTESKAIKATPVVASNEDEDPSASPRPQSVQG